MTLFYLQLRADGRAEKNVSPLRTVLLHKQESRPHYIVTTVLQTLTNNHIRD